MEGFAEAARVVAGAGIVLVDRDYTVLYPVHAQNGMKGRCYYYKGNFFQPMSIHHSFLGKMKKAKREFYKANAEMIERDRADPGYKTVLELFDEQFMQVNKEALMSR